MEGMAGPGTEVRLSREMRLVDVVMIGVGAMIGAGIFVLTGIAAGVAGPALLVAFALNGAVSLLTAMSYAELGSCFHDAGGGYLWVKKALPDPNGFLSGWMSWFAHAVACSLYALGFGAYFGQVLRMLGWDAAEHLPISLEKLLATGVVILFGWINYRGASETGKAGNIVTAAKMIILAAFIGLGLTVMFSHPQWTGEFRDFLPKGWGGVFMAMGLTFIAFEGYEIIAQCSEEVQNPRRNIPRAVFISLAVVVPVYLLVAWVAIGAVDGGGVPTWQYLAAKKEIAMVEAAGQFVRGGAVVLLIGGLLSTMSALNATIFSSSRVSFAMARDHNLPGLLARLSARRKTPHLSIVFSLVIVVAMLLWLPIEDVASAADVMFLLLFLQVNFALIRLRRTMPDLDRGFRVPLFPVLPWIAIAGNLFIAGWLFVYSPMAWLSVALWIGGGWVLHRYYSGPKEEAAVDRRERIERIERKEYSVLVAVASPLTAPSLIAVGTAVARRHGGEVVCVSVVEVAEDRPLVSGLEQSGEADRLVTSMVEQARKEGLAARGFVKVAHRISEALAETVREEKCNFIVMGRGRREYPFDRLFASAVEGALSDVPCDLAVVTGTVRRGIVGRIVLPVSVGDNARLAAELAPALAEWCDGDVRPIVVVPPEASTASASVTRKDVEALLGESGVTARLGLVRHESVAEAILRDASSGDLVVLGASSIGWLAGLLAPTVPQELLERGKVPLVVLRRFEERRRGWLDRALRAG